MAELRRRNSGADTQAEPAKDAEVIKEQNFKHDPERLWYIHGKAYDLSKFVAVHPGGDEAIMLVRGRDCTALFESYHPFTDRPKKVLKKYMVPDVPRSVLLKYVIDTSQRNYFYLANGEEDPFWSALKHRVGEYMKANKLERTMDWPMFLYGMGLIALQLTIYFYGYLRGHILSGVALGFVSWLIAGSMGHEASHYGISSYPIVNKLMTYWTVSGIANPVLWAHQHVYGHHSFTNDFELDPDLHAYEYFLRMHKKNKHSPLHNLLNYRAYILIWWAHTVFGEVLLAPIRAVATGYVQVVTRMTDTGLLSMVYMLVHTFAWVGLLVIIPWFTTTTNPLYLFACYHFTCGAIFGVFSQINHLNEESVKAAQKPTGWAQQQIETAGNFCEDSIFWFLFSGGLNLQIEHHLFPGLSHGVLYKISPIIKATCAEFGVEFKTYDSVGSILDTVYLYFSNLAQAVSPKLKEVYHLMTPKGLAHLVSPNISRFLAPSPAPSASTPRVA